MTTTSDVRGVVYTLPRPWPPASPDGHELCTHEAYAQRVATLKGYRYGGLWEPGLEVQEGERVYLVPSETVCGEERRARVGVRSPHDLLGGVVPHDHVATKVISHGLVSQDAKRPEGWSHELSQRVRAVVLPGYSAFDGDDVLAAVELLLPSGTVRVKLAEGIGGAGQWLVRSRAEAVATIDALASSSVSRGVVVELNLEQVKTLSIGRVELDGAVVCYHGTQHEVRNNHGHMVYGGSRLHVVRGDWAELLAHTDDATVRLACEQVLEYDTAVRHCFPQSFMSRSNYDVAQGFDAQVRWRSGVLEQSWRVGGATGAELLAFSVFRDDPERRSVDVSTTERYGHDVEVPAGADVYYQGVDPKVGPLVKYAMVI